MRGPAAMLAAVAVVFCLAFGAWWFLRPGGEVVLALWFEDRGSGAALSREVQESVLFAMDYFNGLYRGKLRLRPLVVTGMPDGEAVKAIRESGASVAIVGATSGFVSRVYPLLDKAGVPAIATNANAPALAVKGDLLYRYSGPSGAPELGDLVRSVYPGTFKRYLAMLDSSNLIYCRDQLDGFKKALGVEPEKVIIGNPGESFNSFRLEVVTGGYDGFFLALPAYYSGLFMEILSSLVGEVPTAVAGWGVSSVSAALAGPRSRALGVVFSPVELDMEGPFMKYLLNRIDGLPSLSAVDSGYGVVSMAVDAIKLGGVGPESAAQGLRSLRVAHTLRGDFPLDEAGDVVLPLYQVRFDGQAWRTIGEVAGR